MSIEALDWAFKLNRPDMTSTMKLVLLVLADFAGDEDEAYPRQNTIATRALLRREAVNKNLKKLEDLGVIEATGRTHATGATRSSVYKLMIPNSSRRDPRDTDKSVNHDHTPGVRENHTGESDDHTRSDRGSQRGVNDEHTLNLPLEPSFEPPPKKVLRGPAAPFPENAFETFWKRYPNKSTKAKARESFSKIEAEGNVEFSAIMEGLEFYLNKDDFRDWCMGVTWLNQSRWEDRPPQKKTKASDPWNGMSGKRTAAI